MRIKRITKQDSHTQKLPHSQVVHKPQSGGLGEDDKRPSACDLPKEEVVFSRVGSEVFAGHAREVVAWVCEDQDDAAKGCEGFENG